MNRRLMTAKVFHLSSGRRYGVCVMLLAIPLLLASSAFADTISIGFQEPGTNSGKITTEATGSGDLSLPPISYGTFNVNQASAQDFVVLGPPGQLNSQVLDISTPTAGILTIWITAQGLSYTGAQDFVSSFAVNTLSGSIIGVTENTYESPTNARYSGVLLASADLNSIGSQGPFTISETTSGTYSVTEQYVIFDIGGATGNDNLTIDLTASPVPEPASLGLLGAGLLGMIAFLKVRRRITLH